ncbi:hypothetical protein [Streptomyces sp. NPDC047928]|uniref:hypothetical protein n=1 Tax=unclassified Streptomyces TaxID=2593676 RepID=UPI003720B274
METTARRRVAGARAADLTRLREAVAAHRLVNLTGPLGIGKTWLAARAWTIEHPAHTEHPAHPARPEDPAHPVVLDGVDGEARADAARRTYEERTGARTVVISRRPLTAFDGWADHSPAVVTLAPLPDDDIDALARAAGIEEPDARALAVRLAGGVPLLAAAACRALHAGTAPDAPGAVADRVADEILQRLAGELRGGRTRHALRLLATVGAADERLLAGGPDLFAALARLSVVSRGPLGLTVREPYRTVLELAYRWRLPTAHRTVRARAVTYRHALLARARDQAERADLVEQGLFLTGDPGLRGSLFPPAESAARVGPAQDGDAEAVAGLMHRWALRGGFDPGRAGRLAEHWMSHDIGAFHLARDRDGRPVGLAGLLPFDERTADGAEPLLQQHTERLLGGGDGRGGLLLGAAYCPEPATHARILRYILRHAVASGHLVVSTASPDYQGLVQGLGFRPHGGIRDDIYRCGRRPEVYSNDFTATALPWWLRRLGRPADPGRVPDDRLVAEVSRALSRIRDPRSLAGSPLVGSPVTPTAARLGSWLHDAVLELGTSDADADAEAAAILQAYYLAGADSHHQVAHRLHMSRATYFRRLRRGLETIAARFTAESAEGHV